ncbi:MAG: alpha-galactosidase [Clostridia bacterium]|nr:alpha-galactosidase [Clostridia bacterium]
MNKITYCEQNGIFRITTKNTEYAFQVIYGKYLASLYYGKKGEKYPEYSARPLAFSSYAEEDEDNVYFETMKTEYPFFGSGDFGADAIRLLNVKGNNTTLFLYDGYEIIQGRKNIENLPFAASDENTESLVIRMKDEFNSCKLKLYYTVFYDSDVISRYAELNNDSENNILVENIKSLNIDLDDKEYDVITLTGAHYYERSVNRFTLASGKYIAQSARGTSSHHCNPFLAVCEKSADYTKGEVYGFNFIYSGGFENIVEKQTIGKTRVQIGINGATDGLFLQKGESFLTPEAVMTYSDKGIGGLSRNFHSFIKKHIIRTQQKNHHPLVLNTWEAFYFDIDEEKLLKLADVAKELGIDTLVVDDGWFSTRNTENSGLGDWYVNKTKFPDGLKTFSEKIAEKGINLGIWIEPEMVDPDSDLYRNHPNWVLNAYGRPLSFSRNQLVLNLALPEVLENLKEQFTKAFDGVKFSYIKWDMNRSLSMVGNNFSGGNLSDNGLYRKYIEGVYALHEWFNRTYKDVIIEGCSGGGGRYDLGMMHYVTQMWTSDNTFPADRARIQFGSLLAYPALMMSCHVSNYKDAMEDENESDFRYKVAAQGVLGYEMDVLSVSEVVKTRIAKQINAYKQIKDIILGGEFYPIYGKDGIYIFYYNSEKTGEILLCYSNITDKKEFLVPIEVADDNSIYRDAVSGKEYVGAKLKKGINLIMDKRADYIHFIKSKKETLL